MLWNIRDAKPSWLDLRDPDGWWDAGVRFDGCVHLTRYFNIPITEQTEKEQQDEDNSDYFHLCDIDETIARLQEIKAKAVAHFGDHWPE